MDNNIINSIIINNFKPNNNIIINNHINNTDNINNHPNLISFNVKTYKDNIFISLMILKKFLL